MLSKTEANRLKQKYGKWALVTGATLGIGREVAEQLAFAGLNLIISARGAEKLNATATALISKYNVEVMVVPADAGIADEVNKLIAATQKYELGLVVIAAGYGTSGNMINNTVEDEVDMLRVNCEGLLRLTHYFGNRFAQQKRGGIILMSSIVAFQGVAYAANYAATKAYVQSLAEALHIELKPMGVDVLAAAPGPVESSFGERANMQMGKALKPSDVAVPILQALGKKSIVYPGMLTKILVGALSTAPRWGKVKIMQQVMGGFTAHQRK